MWLSLCFQHKFDGSSVSFDPTFKLAPSLGLCAFSNFITTPELSFPFLFPADDKSSFIIPTATHNIGENKVYSATARKFLFSSLFGVDIHLFIKSMNIYWMCHCQYLLYLIKHFFFLNHSTPTTTRRTLFNQRTSQNPETILKPKTKTSTYANIRS